MNLCNPSINRGFLGRPRNNTSRAWYRACTHSGAKESFFFHFQGVTVATNQPVFILYVSTMNLCNPSINRGFLGRTRNNTSRAWYRTCTHSGAKESVLSNFQGVTVETNQPVFILYVSTMNVCNLSINRGFLGRTRNNTSRAWHRTCTHSGAKESFFPFPGRHSRNKPASLHPLCINNEPVQPIDQ